MDLCGQEAIQQNLNYMIRQGNHFQPDAIHRLLGSAHPLAGQIPV